MGTHEDYWNGVFSRREENDIIRRGEIYWVKITGATGHEIMKDRPAIVISSDALNNNRACVTVVMLSAAYHKQDMIEHVPVRSTGKPSTALCEHIYTVDKSRLGKSAGRITPDELVRVEAGILSGLGMACTDLARPKWAVAEPEATPCTIQEDAASAELLRAQTERDTYRTIYEGLLDRLTGRASA